MTARQSLLGLLRQPQLGWSPQQADGPEEGHFCSKPRLWRHPLYMAQALNRDTVSSFSIPCSLPASCPGGPALLSAPLTSLCPGISTFPNHTGPLYLGAPHDLYIGYFFLRRFSLVPSFGI